MTGRSVGKIRRSHRRIENKSVREPSGRAEQSRNRSEIIIVNEEDVETHKDTMPERLLETAWNTAKSFNSPLKPSRGDESSHLESMTPMKSAEATACSFKSGGLSHSKPMCLQMLASFHVFKYLMLLV